MVLKWRIWGNHVDTCACAVPFSEVKWRTVYVHDTTAIWLSWVCHMYPSTLRISQSSHGFKRMRAVDSFLSLKLQEDKPNLLRCWQIGYVHATFWLRLQVAEDPVGQFGVSLSLSREHGRSVGIPCRLAEKMQSASDSKNQTSPVLSFTVLNRDHYGFARLKVLRSPNGQNQARLRILYIIWVRDNSTGLYMKETCFLPQITFIQESWSHVCFLGWEAKQIATNLDSTSYVCRSGWQRNRLSYLPKQSPTYDIHVL